MKKWLIYANQNQMQIQLNQKVTNNKTIHSKTKPTKMKKLQSRHCGRRDHGGQFRHQQHNHQNKIMMKSWWWLTYLEIVIVTAMMMNMNLKWKRGSFCHVVTPLELFIYCPIKLLATWVSYISKIVNLSCTQMQFGVIWILFIFGNVMSTIKLLFYVDFILIEGNIQCMPHYLIPHLQLFPNKCLE